MNKFVKYPVWIWTQANDMRNSNNVKNKNSKYLIRLFDILVSILILSLSYQVAALPVYPGAEGFGTATTAGSGRHLNPITTTLLHVTNLNPDGPGSFKEALETQGSRVVVFDVSGTIEVNAPIVIDDPYITIAGQTAPSPGVTIKGVTLVIKTHDVLVQHLRIRVGDNLMGYGPGNRDGIAIEYVSGGDDVFNVVIDHCSVSWALDGTIDLWRDGVHDITISHTLLSEALDHSLHPKGPHSTGLLIGQDVKDVTFNKSLLASNSERNPLIRENTSTEIVNNVIYNWDPYGYMAYGNSQGPANTANTNLIGNYFNVSAIKQNTTGFSKSVQVSHKLLVQDQIYVEGNIGPGRSLDTDGEWDLIKLGSEEDYRSLVPLVTQNILSPMSALATYDYVIQNVGARPAERSLDVVDQRVINDVINESGQTINCVGSQDIRYFSDMAQGTGGVDSIIIASNSNLDDTVAAYVGKIIEITSGTGIGQIRSITAFDTATNTATVASLWDSGIPDATSGYDILVDCSINAGGWPVIPENTHQLVSPINLHGDSNGDGYTNLENWLQDYSLLVTDPSSLPDLDGDGTPDLIDPDIDGDGLSNDDEALQGTDPVNPDTDGDGYRDGTEVSLSSDPLDINSTPIIVADGDVNLDGQINAADILLAQRQVLGLTSLVAEQIAHGDYRPSPNGDGQLGIADLLLITKTALSAP